MFDDLLPLVRKPSRYLGSEVNAVRGGPGNRDLHVGLAFPDLYEIGMSHLGLSVLYHALNREEGVFAERVFLPDGDLEARLRGRSMPLGTLETRTPLHRLDILGFTLAYELTYTNVLAMLDLGGIPLHGQERRRSHPLVLAGGPCAFNPEPMAPFVDAFVLGEAESSLPRLCRLVAAWKESGDSRDCLLRALDAMEGVYVPSLFRWEPQPGGVSRVLPAGSGRAGPVRKCAVVDLETSPYPTRPPVPFARVVHDRVSIEAARGCPHGCRFCQAGVIYRPYRERSPERIQELASQCLASTGYADLSLMSLSIGDYSGLLPLSAALMARFEPRRVSLSLPSIRVGTLAPAVVEEMLRVRRTGLTLAPEAATARLRGVINKNIDEEEVFRTARLLASSGWRSLKLYFMIGLPLEEDGDIEAMVRLARETLKNVRGAKGGHFQLTVNVSTFVPKPHTAFQWDAQSSRQEAERKQHFLKRSLSRSGFRLKWHDPRLSLLEGLMARGNRDTSSLIECAFRLGCRLDGWTEHLRYDLWEEAFARCGLALPDSLHPCPEFSQPLPWDWVGTGVSKPFLIRERQRASGAEYTPVRCTGHCAECGLCGDPAASSEDLPEGGAASAPDRSLPSPLLACLHHPAAGGAASAPDRSQSAGPVSPAGPAVAATGDAQTRIRFAYRKRPPATALSHLETLNLFQRALRRACLPLAFTEGEHPHPRLSFSPALSVGIESLAEYLDGWFSGPVDAAAAADRLNAELPGGFHIFEAGPVALHSPSLEESIAWIEYEIAFPAAGEVPGARELLERALADSGATISPSEAQAPDKPGQTQILRGAALEVTDAGLRLRCRLFRSGGALPSPNRILEALPPELLPDGTRPRILKTRTSFLEPFSGFLLQPTTPVGTAEPGATDG